MPDRSYKHVFFDLDHTLWDYDRNATETLVDLYHRFDIGAVGIDSADTLVSSFLLINNQLWDSYHNGTIDKYYLRNERFRLVFEHAGAIMKLVNEELLKLFNKKYLIECPQKTTLLPGAMDILQYLQGNYQIHLITNGFDEIQGTKIEKSGIKNYFAVVITSEKAGFKKPMSGIFTYALKHTGATLNESIMIGDNLNADIRGALGFGMDAVYFNPKNALHNEVVTHEIKALSELKMIL